MSLSKESVASLVKEYGKSPSNTGSTEVQVALLTKRINELTEHLKQHSKDFHSRVGLMRLVGQRKSLLKYLQRKSDNGYRELIAKLGLRK